MMKNARELLLTASVVASLLALSGCGDDPSNDASEATDAGSDAGASDAGADTERDDSGVTDASPTDGGDSNDGVGEDTLPDDGGADAVGDAEADVDERDSTSDDAGSEAGLACSFSTPFLPGDSDLTSLAANPAQCGQDLFTWMDSDRLGEVTVIDRELNYGAALLDLRALTFRRRCVAEELRRANEHVGT